MITKNLNKAPPYLLVIFLLLTYAGAFYIFDGNVFTLDVIRYVQDHAQSWSAGIGVLFIMLLLNMISVMLFNYYWRFMDAAKGSGHVDFNSTLMESVKIDPMDVLVYKNMNEEWVVSKVVDGGYLDTLYFNQNVIKHSESGRGALTLCSGPRGAGKSTLWHLHGGQLGLDIYELDVSAVMSDDALGVLIEAVPRESLLTFDGLESTTSLLSRLNINGLMNVLRPSDNFGVTLGAIIRTLQRLKDIGMTVVVTAVHPYEIHNSLLSRNLYDRVVRVDRLTIPVVIDYITSRFDIGVDLVIDWHPILASELHVLVKGCSGAAEMRYRLKTKFNT